MKNGLISLMFGATLLVAMGATTLSAEGKCGAGKCGDAMEKPAKCGAAKCGDAMKKAAKCGAAKEKKCGSSEKKSMKCGANK